MSPRSPTQGALRRRGRRRGREMAYESPTLPFVRIIVKCVILVIKTADFAYEDTVLCTHMVTTSIM